MATTSNTTKRARTVKIALDYYPDTQTWVCRFASDPAKKSGISVGVGGSPLAACDEFMLQIQNNALDARANDLT